MNYEVKNVKTFMGMDTYGYNATLYRDGKKVATVVNDGGGGPTMVHWDSKEEATIMKDYAASLPCMTFGAGEDEFTCSHNEETVIGELVDKYENTKWLKRQCKNKTLFRLDGDTEGEYRTVKAPYVEKVRKYLQEKYGDKVVEIANERLLEAKGR